MSEEEGKAYLGPPTLRLPTEISGTPYTLEVSGRAKTIGITLKKMDGRIPLVPQPSQAPQPVKVPGTDLSILVRSPFELSVFEEQEGGSRRELRIFSPGSSLVGNSLTLRLFIEHDEGIYGLGEFFGRLNKNGQALETYIYDAVGLPNDKTYVAYPFFWSTRGYGMLVNEQGRVFFDFGASFCCRGSVKVPSAEPQIFLFIAHEPREIVRQFWELTGYPEVPPKWSFGIWYSSWRDKGYVNSPYKTQEDVIRMAERIREMGIPGDVIHLDPHYSYRPVRPMLLSFMIEELGMNIEEVRQALSLHEEKGVWSYAPLISYLRERYGEKVSELRLSGSDSSFIWQRGFQDPKGFNERLHAMGFHTSIWVNPYAQLGGPWYRELEAADALLKVDGNVILEMPVSTVGGKMIGYSEIVRDMGAVDLTSERGRAIFASKISQLLDLGFDAIKTDYGEGAPGDEIGRLHNLYATVYNHVVYEEIKKRRGEAIVWGRSGGLGIHRYPIRWGGDPESTPEGMVKALRGALCLSCSGTAFSSFDIGGYGGKPSTRLFIRWFEMGLLFSHSRLHGTTEREPWSYGDEALAAFKRYAELRYSLFPYIYSCVNKGIKEGKPLVRPLVFDFPEDRATRDVEDEFMLGDALLVAPVMDDVSEERDVYLPKGTWYVFWTSQRLEGGKWVKVKAPLDLIPLFVMSGKSLVYSLNKGVTIGEESLRKLRVVAYGDVKEIDLDFGQIRVKAEVLPGKTLERDGLTITFETVQ
ncbi:MAG: glycoside hydrolase family 31 protein [Thermoprotei archaeon]